MFAMFRGFAMWLRLEGETLKTAKLYENELQGDNWNNVYDKVRKHEAYQLGAIRISLARMEQVIKLLTQTRNDIIHDIKHLKESPGDMKNIKGGIYNALEVAKRISEVSNQLKKIRFIYEE